MLDKRNAWGRPPRIFTFLVVLILIVVVAAAGAVATNYQQLGNLVRVVALIRSAGLQPVSTNNLVQGAIKGMVESLRDPYSVYYTPQEFRQLQEQIRGSFGGLGIAVGLKNDYITIMKAPFPGTPAAKAGLKEGDMIVKVGNKDARGMDLDTAVTMMRGPVGTKVKLTIRRLPQNELKTYVLTREEINVPTVNGMVLPGTKIGLLAISQFTEQTPDELPGVLDKLTKQGIKGLILDLRNNPGGELSSVLSVANYFVPKGPVVYIDYRGGKDEVHDANGNRLQLPLVVLVNENTASAAEILSGAIKDTKAGILVGTKTFGKGIVQTVYPLEDGAGLKLTTARYLTPAKHDINKKGIMPNVVVPDPTSPGHDEQLAKALDILKSEIKG